VLKSSIFIVNPQICLVLAALIEEKTVKNSHLEVTALTQSNLYPPLKLPFLLESRYPGNCLL